jgi:hypothetical protein
MRRAGIGPYKAVVLIVVALILASTEPAWARSSRFEAGYQASRDAFRSIHASWTVHSISCPGTNSAGYNASAWLGVGLGPTFARSEQVVTEAFCTGTVASYVAYLDVGGVQAAGAAAGVPLRAGDHVSATVSYMGVFALRSGSSTYRVSRYRLAFTDLTEHRSFAVSDSIDCLRHPCDRSTAEVTAGLPFAGYSALADYGTATFSKVAITDASGRRGSLAPNRRWRVSKLTELHGATHNPSAVASGLTHGGSRFLVFWRAF